MPPQYVVGNESTQLAYCDDIAMNSYYEIH